MESHQTVSLLREVGAIQVPFGTRIPLEKGTIVTITQTLGGNFTVMTDRGFLARIAGKDADALGLPVPATPPIQTFAPVAAAVPLEPGKTVDPQLVWDQLKTVYDPEIPVNIVDLGLVYCCQVLPAEPEGSKVQVALTMTAPGCGMGGMLRQEAFDKIMGIAGVKEAQVELVWDPPWDMSKMSEAA
ncbi:MAG: DUF59 domain-containing protein [Candidatus Wallbacteria bacterium]|nr:DUF59 domain-containing protein [Candidatus Wallbacteria bacterium]